MANKSVVGNGGGRDHDLLIEVNTKLDRAIVDIKELKDNLVDRVNHLEDEKFSKEDALVYQKQIDTVSIDHEARIRSLEIQRWMLAGGIIVVSFLAQYVMSFITK